MRIDLDDRLSEIIPKENIIKNENMSRHTTFRTGGPADYFIKIGKKEELKKNNEILQAKLAHLSSGSLKNEFVSKDGYNL